MNRWKLLKLFFTVPSLSHLTLQPHELQHHMLPCASLSPGVFTNLCPLNWWCCPTISSSVAPFSSYPQSFPSIRVFSNESALGIRWPEDWSFGISPSNEHSALISFKIDWFDLCTVLGTLKSLLQHHNSKASILRCSAFFRVQLLHQYMITGKTIALNIATFVGKASTF